MLSRTLKLDNFAALLHRLEIVSFSVIGLSKEWISFLYLWRNYCVSFWHEWLTGFFLSFRTWKRVVGGVWNGGFVRNENGLNRNG